MIVRCPECQTSFNVPGDKVPGQKGAKVRCSKCSHTFRVRPGADGEAEIFYKNDGVADPPTQELGDLFDESFAEEFDEAFEATTKSDDVDEEAGRRTMMGMPSVARGSGPSPFQSKSSSTAFNPFPLAGDLNESAPAPAPIDMQNTSGIDLFDGEEPAPRKEVEHHDPFAGAFEDDGAPAAPADDVLQPRSGPRSLSEVSAQPQAYAAPAPAPAPAAPAPVYTPPADDSGQLSGPFAGQVESEFGPADELVDPSFGEDTASFDPATGTIQQPENAGLPTRPAPTPAAAAAALAANTATIAPAPQPAKSAPRPQQVVEDWDVAPHRIGGGGFQKFANFLLILMIVAVGFIGVVAFQAGGFIDFTRVDHMLDVAFQGKEFEPRKEWEKPAPPAPAPKPDKAVVVEDVFASLVSIGKKDKSQVLVVRGTLQNETDAEIATTRVRIILLDAKEKVLREATVQGGRVVGIDAVAELTSSSDVGGLPYSAAAPLAANATIPFMTVISDVPKSILENRDVTYRIEVVEPSN